MVTFFRDLGVRQIHLAYNRNNSVADGCHDVERGLTPLGRRIVAAINDAGVLMDCSHTGRRCSLDIMSVSTAPVVFSHSNPRHWSITAATSRTSRSARARRPAASSA